MSAFNGHINISNKLGFNIEPITTNSDSDSSLIRAKAYELNNITILCNTHEINIFTSTDDSDRLIELLKNTYINNDTRNLYELVLLSISLDDTITIYNNIKLTVTRYNNIIIGITLRVLNTLETWTPSLGNCVYVVDTMEANQEWFTARFKVREPH